MAEYINRERARFEAKRYFKNMDEIQEDLDMLFCMLPAENVAPVRHGRWDDEHKCTVCHNEAFFKISNIRPDYDYDWEENLVETGNYIWDTEWIETAYCPNCGAKMDGGAEAR